MVGLIRARRVHFGGPWRSADSFGFVEFIRARRGGRRIFKIVGLIRAHHSGVHLGAVGLFWPIRARPGVSLGLFRRALVVVGFIRQHACGCGVHSDSIGPFGRALGVIGCCWVSWVPLGASWPWGFVGFMRARALGVV